LLQILKPGLLDTLQDAGRFGFAVSGINTNGVMDSYAMQVANALVANHVNEAVIEMHFPAAVIRFEQATLIALSGADFGAVINETAIAINKVVLVPKGAVLSFKRKMEGSRVYLSVYGGFAVKPWLHSVSTNIVAAAGGLGAGKLVRDDTIFFKQKTPWATEVVKVFRWRADTATAYMDAHYLYCIKGPEWDWLTPESQHLFLQEPFSIAPQSDRMAIRLQGEKLTCTNNGASLKTFLFASYGGDLIERPTKKSGVLQMPITQMVSAAVAMGSIQLLPNGDALVLMADHQTTGGYPRIATIITAHLPKLAQATAGDYIHLLQVPQHTAEELLIAQQDELSILNTACKFKVDGLTLNL